MTKVGTIDVVKTKEKYQGFIREAFIKPIRSVYVVDDKFPTLDGLIEGKQPKGAETENLKKIIQLCRDPQKNWMLEVHNGAYQKDEDQNFSEVNVKGLHQSDLLILDYNLDGNDDHSRSLSIVHDIAENEHFNLVVVYSLQDSTEVFTKIVSTFLDNWNAMEGDDPDDDILDDIIQEFGKDAISKLIGTVKLGDYLRLREKNLTNIRSAQAASLLTNFCALYGKYSKEIDWDQQDCFKWVMRQVESKFENRKSSSNNMSWHFTTDEGKSWLRTDRLFLTVVKKDAEEIMDGLEKALSTWQPSPNRLIITKIRNEFDAHGVSAENTTLTDKTLQCGWLENIRKANEGEKIEQIASLIERNTTGLFGAIWENVANFSHDLLEEVEASNMASSEFFRIKNFNEPLQRTAKLRHNANVSSMPVQGDYLTTGHVFSLDEELWICLTPPCDLVPGRPRSKQKFQILSPALPFKAIKLHPISEGNGLKYASTGHCVFLDLERNGNISTYHIKEECNPATGPEWEEMFVSNSGSFEFGTNTIRIGRLTEVRNPDADEKERAKEEVRPCLQVAWKEVSIVSQLRYQYAIHLMNSLGQTITRVGLDFM